MQKTSSNTYHYENNITLIVSPIITLCYMSTTDVMSMSEATHVLTSYGHVQIMGDNVMFVPTESILGYPTELIQALEIYSTHYTVHI